MVRKGGNGSSRNKYNQRNGGNNGGRPNGGGMNDYRNRSSSNGLQQQRQSNGIGGSGYGGVGQRPMSRFSNAPAGINSAAAASAAYQSRPYESNSKPAYAPRAMNGTGSYYDAIANGTASVASSSHTRVASTEQSKYVGFQAASKPPPPPPAAVATAYGHHQTYPSVMATSPPASLYSLPPPPFSSVPSGLPFNYPPPVLPVKN